MLVTLTGQRVNSLDVKINYLDCVNTLFIIFCQRFGVRAFKIAISILSFCFKMHAYCKGKFLFSHSLE